MSFKAPFTAANAICGITHIWKDESACPSSSSTSCDTNAESMHLPAAFRLNSHVLMPLLPSESAVILNYLSNEFSVDRLNVIHKHLWFAGLARPARPLHHQFVLGRTIVVSERADLHLLWRKDQIFIKPLGELIGCEYIWSKYICRDAKTYGNAAGFLLSYMWLITTKSDLRIAHQHGLIGPNITWEAWIKFSREVLQIVDHTSYRNVNARYLYGELRITQLNYISRWCSLTRGRRAIFQGYFSYYSNYASFFQEHTTGLAAGLVYIAIVLTAMQVGLATTKLGHNIVFQAVSYGFTVFSILAPLIALVAVSLVIGIGYCFNWKHALQDRREKANQLPGVLRDIAMVAYEH